MVIRTWLDDKEVFMSLRKLLGLCEHDWKEVTRFAIKGYWSIGDGRIATEYHQQCTKCKKMRKFTL
jgi:hypothetical protein